MDKLVTLIPARGGSKSIPKKNLAKLAGKPLLQYAIEAAKPICDEVWVSTDDKEISQFAKQLGAKVIIRPDELCTDEIMPEPAVSHFLDNVECTAVLLLECTSPLITSDDLQGLVDVYNTGMDDLPAILIARHLLFIARIIPELTLEEHVINTWVELPHRKRSQRFELLDYTYTEAGAWLFSRTHFRKYAIRSALGINKYCIMAGHNIDIDSQLDLELAEVILRNSLDMSQ